MTVPRVESPPRSDSSKSRPGTSTPSVCAWTSSRVRRPGGPRRPLPPGDEGRRRQVPAERRAQARLHPHRLQRPEGLSRRRDLLEGALRHGREEGILREGRCPAHLDPPRGRGRAVRGDGDPQPLHSRRRRHSGPGTEPEIRAQARLPRRDGVLVQAGFPARATASSSSGISTSRPSSRTCGATSSSWTWYRTLPSRRRL